MGIPVAVGPPRAPGMRLVEAGLIVVLAAVPLLFAPILYDDFTLPKQAGLFVAMALVLAGAARGAPLLPASRALRWLVAGWAAWLVLSLVAGIDPRGSVLGYYQYRQGFLTQASCLVLFLAAAAVARRGRERWLFAAGLPGLAGAFAYTAVQSAGLDPVNWWLDTSDRAIGTIGNANELAAYAVAAVALTGSATLLQGHRRTAAVGAIALAATFVVVESASRAGLVALALAFALIPAAMAWLRLPRRTVGAHAAIPLAGLAAGLLLASAAGGLGRIEHRFDSAFSGGDYGAATRLALWHGTIATIAADPLTGQGPDGLYLAFPLHRPPGLGGEFETSDLVAQSAHSWPLDLAANIGLPGLLLVAALIGATGAASLRAERPALRGQPGDEAVAYAWAASAGYLVIAVANPVSLAPQALFFALLGILAGRAERLQGLPVPALPSVSVPLRRAARGLTLLAAGLLIVAAAIMPVADFEANRGFEQHSAIAFEDGARHFATARRLDPFERSYATREAEAWLAAGVGGDLPELRRALEAYRRLDERFGLRSRDAFGLAAALIGLGAPEAEVRAAIDGAVALAPEGRNIDWYADQLRAVASGGVLQYDEQLGVYVEPPVP